MTTILALSLIWIAALFWLGHRLFVGERDSWAPAALIYAGLGALGAIIIVLVLLTRPASAHSWYDPACCSGRDCAEVATRNVHATEDGWLIHLEAGEHPMVTGRFIQVVAYGDPKIRQSLDDNFHVCIGSSGITLYCLYVPPQIG